MSSGTVLVGTDGFTTMTLGTTIMPATGAMSRMKFEVELVECRVERVRRMDEEKRIAIRGCAHDGLGGDITARARPVLDDELLAEPLREPLAIRRATMSAPPLEECKVVGRKLVVAGRHTPTVLDLVEEPLDQISGSVKMRTEAERLFRLLLGGIFAQAPCWRTSILIQSAS
jgi:hypothetical protein